MPDYRRRLERVRAAGGAAASAALSVLDLVFAAGGSSGSGAVPARAARSRRFLAFALLHALVACCCFALVFGTVTGAACRGAPVVGTLGGDCSSFLSRIDLVILTFSRLLFFSTLGSGCSF